MNEEEKIVQFQCFDPSESHMWVLTSLGRIMELNCYLSEDGDTVRRHYEWDEVQVPPFSSPGKYSAPKPQPTEGCQVCSHDPPCVCGYCYADWVSKND